MCSSSLHAHSEVESTHTGARTHTCCPCSSVLQIAISHSSKSKVSTEHRTTLKTCGTTNLIGHVLCCNSSPCMQSLSLALLMTELRSIITLSRCAQILLNYYGKTFSLWSCIHSNEIDIKVGIMACFGSSHQLLMSRFSLLKAIYLIFYSKRKHLTIDNNKVNV